MCQSRFRPRRRLFVWRYNPKAQREMPPEPGVRLEQARSASGDELKSLVHEAGEDALLALIENPNLEESHIALLLDRLDLPASVLSAVAAEGKWASSEGVRLR